MISEMKRRGYTLKRRAERQEETRARIVEATVALHEALGPGRTTISAIAERAGVERLTVYRHFPDEPALFAACSGHYGAAHPAPDPAGWQALADPAARTGAALRAIYRSYRRVRPMFARVLHDAEDIPALRAVVAGGYGAYLDAVRADLVAAWAPPPARRRTLAAALGLALRFQTWQALADDGLKDGAIVELMGRMIRTVPTGERGSGGSDRTLTRVKRLTGSRTAPPLEPAHPRTRNPRTRNPRTRTREPANPRTPEPPNRQPTVSPQ